MKSRVFFIVVLCAVVGSLITIACGGDDAATAEPIANGDGDASSSSSSSSSGSTSSSSSSSSSSGDASTPDGAGSTSSGSVGAYDKDGTGAFTTAKASVTNGSSTFELNLFVPSAAGAHPVVSLSPGLLQPASAYIPFAKRLASYGIVVVMRDDPGPFTSTSTVVNDIAYVVTTWLPAENAKAGSALNGKIDIAKVGVAGHSRGGKASILAAENGLKGKVKGWFGLDPVDATVIGDNTKARDTLATVGIPIAMIGAEVASSCSPAADTYAALYAAAATPTTLIKAKNAGHTQLEDPAACNQCNLCTPAGTADTAIVLAYSVRYLTAFFARELLLDASVGASFAGAGGPADVTAGRVEITSK